MDRVAKWRSLGLGMFIHFGVYFKFGGMYRGKKVESGYSEQIMQFARIPRSEYGDGSVDDFEREVLEIFGKEIKEFVKLTE